MYKEITGDLVKLGLQGKFDVVIQGNNCFCVQGAGLAPQFVAAFGSDQFPMEEQCYAGDINKLGTIDYQTGKVINGKFEWAKSNNFFDGCLTVINCYTQFDLGRNHKDGKSVPGDYEALTLCMRKINHIFKGKHIGVPQIGCGLAGLDWNIVSEIIATELKDCQVTIVIFDQPQVSFSKQSKFK
jgi:O-acetyl-ADP-ribose deacetylase (regulator of RNase III)